MSAQYVRTYYRVPAKRGMRITFEDDGRQGRIVSFPGARLGVRFDGERATKHLHPTWKVTYHTEKKSDAQV